MSVERRAALVVHEKRRIPSITALSALMRVRGHDHRVSALVHRLSEVTAFRFARSEAEGGPTVLVSRRFDPMPQRALALTYRRRLDKAVGTKAERAAALELPLAAELAAILTPHRYRVEHRGRQFDGECADVTVIGRGRMLDIEVRNRRSEWHETLKPKDREMVERDVRQGIVPVFVVPRCTSDWRVEVEGMGGIVVETFTYIVTTEAQRQLWEGYGVATWTTALAHEAVPEIARQITAQALQLDLGGERAVPKMPDQTAERTAGREVSRVIKRRDYALIVEWAKRLHAEGVRTVEEAANRIGCSRRTLFNAAKSTGQQLPWTNGGAGRGQGRKSKCKSDGT